MNSTIIFLSLFFIILSLMLVFKIKIYFNLFSNKCVVIIYLYKLRIITIEINLIGLTFKINNSKKTNKFSLILTKEQEYFIKQIKSTILDKLYYDDISINLKIGTSNAFSSSIASGTIDTFVSMISSKLFYINKDLDLYYERNCLFDKLELVLDMDIKVYFTIFDLIFAIIISLYKRGNYAKQRKRSRRIAK